MLRPYSRHRSRLDFNGLAQSVGTGHSLTLSASPTTVRRPGGAKLLVVLGFGVGADDADGADVCDSDASGSEWFNAAVIRRTRFRARRLSRLQHQPP